MLLHIAGIFATLQQLRQREMLQAAMADQLRCAESVQTRHGCEEALMRGRAVSCNQLRAGLLVRRRQRLHTAFTLLLFFVAQLHASSLPCKVTLATRASALCCTR